VPSSSSPKLEVRGLSVRLGGVEALFDVGFEVAAQEFVVLMGPNGSGKTTLLRTIAGFESAGAGTISLDGRPVARVPAHRRGIGILFQEPALFPRRTVWENVAYGLEVARRPPAEVERRVSEMLTLLRLGPLSERGPSALSGGERQRVALARTLAPGPSLVLLDEPFAAVDPTIRAELRAEFRSVLRRMGVAAIHVTHDREEGLFLGDRVLILSEGRLIEDGPPEALFRSPHHEASARFLGYNILGDARGLWAVHPRDLRLGPAGTGLPATVEVAGTVGPEAAVLLRVENGERVEVRGLDAGPIPAPGEAVGLRWDRAVPIDRAAPAAQS
jgi:ABC-type Fe3+/spermidine/putrescine transport system ATPase subunit